jgi:hypothetical protein
MQQATYLPPPAAGVTESSCHRALHPVGFCSPGSCPLLLSTGLGVSHVPLRADTPRVACWTALCGVPSGSLRLSTSCHCTVVRRGFQLANGSHPRAVPCPNGKPFPSPWCWTPDFARGCHPVAIIGCPAACRFRSFRVLPRDSPSPHAPASWALKRYSRVSPTGVSP